MTEPNGAPPPQGLIVPAAMESVIKAFDKRNDVYTVSEVWSALAGLRPKSETVSPEENKGAWAEAVAFTLTHARETSDRPWDAHFQPIGSATREDGPTVYFPDLREADEGILDHWKTRARSVTSPLLVARYADLVWDLSPMLAKSRRDPEFVRLAIDAYVEIASQPLRETYDAFPSAERALELAIQIKDTDRRKKARAGVLDLHKRQMAAERRMWWAAWDIFDRYSKSELTDAERAGLVADFESILARASDTSDPKQFDPHTVEVAAEKLAKYYGRIGATAEVTRVVTSIAKAFEYFGNLADPNLAAMAFQTSMDAYRRAGLAADADRMLKLIGEKNLESIASMTRIEHKAEVPTDEVEKFLTAVVLDTPDRTFAKMAAEFMLVKATVEAELAKITKLAPLVALIPRTKLAGDRTVAEIGSTADDPIGRLIDHANQTLRQWTPWLAWAMSRATDVHKLTSSEIATWANRADLFGDGRLLEDGVNAFFANDHVKAMHVLIPQIEAAFRTLLGRVGRPTTKPHPTMKQARVVKGMGDLLFDSDAAAALGKYGENLVLHLRTLYADPRGLNLRNDFAHGLMPVEAMQAGQTLWLMHSLLLLGLWQQKKTTSQGEDLEVDIIR